MQRMEREEMRGEAVDGTGHILSSLVNVYPEALIHLQGAELVDPRSLCWSHGQRSGTIGSLVSFDPM